MLKIKFSHFGRSLKSHVRSNSGQTLTEYLILMVLVAIVSFAAVSGLGTAVRNRFELASRKINGINISE